MTTMGAREWADVWTLDPSDGMGRGRLLGYRDFRTEPGSRERWVLDRLLAVPARPPRSSAPPVNPVRSTVPSGQERSRDLTAGDHAWLASLPDDPAKVSDDDARHLARLRHEAKGESDRRLVDRKFAPLVTHHEARAALFRAEQAAHFNARPAAMPAEVREAIIEQSAGCVRTELPGLREAEARNRAREQLQSHGAGVAGERAAKFDAARADVRRICAETGLRSELNTVDPPPPPSWGR